MPGPTQKLDVSLIDASLAVRHHNPTTGLVGAWEYHPLCSIVSITGQIFEDFALLDTNTMQKRHRYPHTDMSRLIIKTEGNTQPILDVDLSDITNQAAWLPNLAGIEVAKADINLWIYNACGGAAGAAAATGPANSLERDALSANDSLFEKTGGLAVDNDIAFAGYAVNDAVVLTFDKNNRGLNVNQANLALDEDEVLNHVGATDSNYKMSDTFMSTVISEDGTEVKASAGNIYGWNIINPSTEVVYVKFYDSLLEPTTTSETPVLILMVPAEGSVFQEPNVRQQDFANGIWVSSNQVLADAGGSAPSVPTYVEARYK